MRLFLSEASVHLSRQFLEKLTDSAIIKIALWEDLSGEVATGSRWLAASPAVVEGCPRWRGPEVRIHLPPAQSLVRTFPSRSDRRNPPINGVKVGLAHAVLPPVVTRHFILGEPGWDFIAVNICISNTTS